MLLEETLKSPIWPILVFWICLVGFGVLIYKYVPPAYQLYRKTQAIAVEFTTFKQEKATFQKQLEAAKAQGFQEGVQSVNIPKKCTAWWFGENSKEKQEQARLAYCKGKL